MYICICNALRKNQVDLAIEEGACSAVDTFNKLGCQPVCGQCVEVIEDSIPVATIAKNTLGNSAR